MHFPSTLSAAAALLVASRLAHAYIPSDVPSDYTYSALQHTDKTTSYESGGDELEALADLPTFDEIANDEDLEIDTSPPPEGIDEDLVPLDELLSGDDGDNRFGDDDNSDEDQLDEIPEDELVFDDGDEDGELPIVDEPVEEEEENNDDNNDDDDEELEIDNGSDDDDDDDDDDTPVLLPTESLPAEITPPSSGPSTSDLPLIIETSSSSSSFSKPTNWTGGWNTTTTFATHTSTAPAGFVTQDVLLNVTRTVIGGGGVPTGNPPAGNGEEEEDGAAGGDDDSAAVAINVSSMRGMVLAGIVMVVGGVMIL